MTICLKHGGLFLPNVSLVWCIKYVIDMDPAGRRRRQLFFPVPRKPMDRWTENRMKISLQRGGLFLSPQRMVYQMCH